MRGLRSEIDLRAASYRTDTPAGFARARPDPGRDGPSGTFGQLSSAEALLPMLGRLLRDRSRLLFA